MSRELLPHHAELLRASAISEEVAGARDYWSATKPIHLERWFGQTQRRLVPALVIPTYDVRGEVVLCQLRPDDPRTVDGRVRKYELPHRARMAVDVPPAVRAVLANPKIPLGITEGARKADAAVSVGLHFIDLIGVWTWRGRNKDGGLTVLSDWEAVALNERLVYLCFDSDAMHKREVHAALRRLWRLLADRGADLRVLELPHGDDGSKVGLDDYLAAGHTREDLLRLAVDELRPLPSEARVTKPRREAPVPATDVLLERVLALLRRYLVLPSAHAERALALWVLHSWAFDAAFMTPYLFVRSAEPESGKSRVLEVLRLLCKTAKRASTITEAALYQAVEAWKPTLLLDEVDNVFTGRGDREVALCAVLNDGYELGGTALRGTQDMEPREFSVFCPKAMAGIDTGRMPDTLRSRCIIITMQKRLASEPVQRLYRRDVAETVEALRDDLEVWAAEHLEELADYRPEPILEIPDRTDETWRLLLAVAALAGGDWPGWARAAAIALAKANVADDAGHGHVLLVAMRKVFDSEGSPLASKTICAALNGDETLPFAEYGKRGDGITPNALARLLRPYGIKPHTVRLGAETAKGYRRDQFADAWERYDASHDPAPPTQPSQASQPSHPRSDGDLDVTAVTDVTATQGPPARVSLFDAPASDLASNNGQVDDEATEPDDYAARFRRRQAEGGWGLGLEEVN